MNKLNFIDSFQLSFSLDSLVRNLIQDHFKYLREELDNNVLYLVIQKQLYPHHNLYLKCNVLLLTDVLEKFKNNRLDNCGLCPSHN